MQNKINLGIIGKSFGYNVIYKSFLKNKNYKIIGFSFKSEKFEKSLMPAVETLINQVKKHHDKITGKVKTHSIDFNQLTPESTNEEQYLNN